MYSSFSGTSRASCSLVSTTRRRASSVKMFVVAEATFVPSALVMVRVALVASPDVLIWFCANRVLPVSELPRFARAWSALENDSALSVIALGLFARNEVRHEIRPSGRY